MRNKPHVWNLDFSHFTFHFSLKFPTFAYQLGTYETFLFSIFCGNCLVVHGGL